jgi:hypothetical protein
LGALFLKTTNEILDRGGPADPDERFWMKAVYGQFKRDARYAEVKARIDAVMGPPVADYDPRASVEARLQPRLQADLKVRLYFAFVTVNSNGIPMKSPTKAILSGDAVPT